MATRHDLDTLDHFAERYGVASSDVTRRIEQDVIGGDWGANGYTTMAQADALASALRLGPGRRLLDLGSGRGWPGLYLAQSTGCHAVLADVPLEGLRVAQGRARREGLTGRAVVVRAGGRSPPFRAGAFDGVCHTDVLC